MIILRHRPVARDGPIIVRDAQIELPLCAVELVGDAVVLAGAGVDQPTPGRRLRVHHGGPRIW